jgi:hypothetical protein
MTHQKALPTFSTARTFAQSGRDETEPSESCSTHLPWKKENYKNQKNIQHQNRRILAVFRKLLRQIQPILPHIRCSEVGSIRNSDLDTWGRAILRNRAMSCVTGTSKIQTTDPFANLCTFETVHQVACIEDTNNLLADPSKEFGSIHEQSVGSNDCCEKKE